MKKFDKYKLKKKISAIGSLAWQSLIIFSKLTSIIFVMITCLLFWSVISIYLLSNGVDFSKEITQMTLIVIICLIFLSIDYVKNLNFNNEKNK